MPPSLELLGHTTPQSSSPRLTTPVFKPDWRPASILCFKTSCFLSVPKPRAPINSPYCKRRCISIQIQCNLGCSGRACFSVQWCTKCAVMKENVQWWKAAFAVMNREEIKPMCIYWYEEYQVMCKTYKKRNYLGKKWSKISVKICSNKFSLKHALCSGAVMEGDDVSLPFCMKWSILSAFVDVSYYIGECLASPTFVLYCI